MVEEKHTYHFDFFKDRIWMFALILPIGFICWLLPFVLLWGLVRSGLEMGTSIIIAFLMLGIPAYLVGWVIIYSYMEGVITRVTFTETEIHHRTPWMLFPLFWTTKKISIKKIEDIALNIPYGTRTAIHLYFHDGKKQRKFYLPRFKNQPNYLEEFRAINARLSHPSDMLTSIGVTRTEQQVKSDMLAAVRSKKPIFRIWDTLVKTLSSVFMLGISFGSGVICLQLPIPGVQVFIAGMTGGFFCFLMSLVATVPILGQVLIWFFGKKAINILFWLVGIQPDTIILSASLNKILQAVLFQPDKIFSLTDFIFWMIFMLSIFYSLDRIMRWLLRMKLPDKNHPVVSQK